MKKLLLLSVMALAGLAASAQFVSNPSVTPKTRTNTQVANMPQTQRTFQAVAPRQDLAKRIYAPTNRLSIDASKLKPVTREERMLKAAASALSQTKAVSKGMMQSHRMVNLQSTKTFGLQQASTRAKAARKAPEFAKNYTGVGYDNKTKGAAHWTMTPTTVTYVDEETEEKEDVDVLVDVIPTPKFLSDLYPEGIPVEYTVDDEGVITIMPQAVANYVDEEDGATVYLTLCSANSEDGAISITVGEKGKLTITEGNAICLGEFKGMEFDAEFGDAYLGWDVLIGGVRYYYQYDSRVDQKYNAHGVDYFNNQPADWELWKGTETIDGEEKTNVFVNLIPCPKTFVELYPDGIDVEYEEIEKTTFVVKPQVIASGEDEDGPYYVMIFSGTADDGNIVLTEDKTGLTTIEGESIYIGAWATDEFDPSYEAYQGGYIIIENPKYRTPDAPAEAPEDVACEPEELVLFAGLGYSGYSYNDNLAMMGAYAPTSFRNCTFDIATNFEWSVKETVDDEESTIKGDERNFTLTTKGNGLYEDFVLTGYNEKEVSEPYTWGTGHALRDDGSVRYEAIHVYAGESANSFEFSDGTFAVMTRQNPDYDLTFYINWATPDIYEQYSSNPTSIATIYSYQGKPATPLYLTGVTLPLVDFEAQDDFNLHIKLCKCKRSATGNLTVGDVIAESDATIDNVVADYEAGIKAVEFTELYVEDEFGMSETIDYLFIEDEFVIVIEGWDNGTFSAVLGSHEYNFNEITSTWFQATGETRMRSYSGGWPQLFIGLLDATYGYLYTEDDTDLEFADEGGTSTIHVDPMYYGLDDETEEPTYSLYVESITEDGEEVEEFPEWLSFEVANEDYTTDTDDDGHEYFVNGIDYDLVVTAAALPAGVDYRTAKVVFYQTGAKLTVTVTQGVDPDGIHTVVAKTPIKNSRAFNLAGQPVGKNFKGIVVKDGKKMLVK
ncbi:MAG: hypothetical protein IKQ37_09595 [Bacteroidaceae bacterium]|nr:hypothetical protein [Bacteroidaceae bacterium]